MRKQCKSFIEDNRNHHKKTKKSPLENNKMIMRKQCKSFIENNTNHHKKTMQIIQRKQ